MKRINRILSIILTVAVIIGTVAFSAIGYDSMELWVKNNWSDIVSSNGYLTMTPGDDNSKMNFSWQSSYKSSKAELEIGKAADLSDAKNLDVKTTFSLFSFEFTHEATATELEADTIYYYKYYSDKVWSDVYSFKTASKDNTKVIFVSDSQLGRYRTGTDEEILQHDTYGWYKTLDCATRNNPDVDFILSAGDQVEVAHSEKQYSLFESVPQLRKYPIAAAIGNHDFYTPNYSSHFNNPNRDTSVPFKFPAGNGYYFLYNDILFIVLDSNVFVPSTHRRILKAACEAYPEAKWRVVSMHHTPYDANAASYFLSRLTRTTITPFFDEFDIDLCLSGHDHYYSRSYIVKHNKVTDDVLCDNQYVNPDGTLYVSANSSSGSNYYNVKTDSVGQECAFWFQSMVPCYSILNVNSNKLTVKTYETDENALIDEISIIKD